MLYCKRCGAEMNGDELFCSKCGMRVNAVDREPERRTTERSSLWQTAQRTNGGQPPPQWQPAHHTDRPRPERYAPQSDWEQPQPVYAPQSDWQQPQPVYAPQSDWEQPQPVWEQAPAYTPAEAQPRMQTKSKAGGVAMIAIGISCMAVGLFSLILGLLVVTLSMSLLGYCDLDLETILVLFVGGGVHLLAGILLLIFGIRAVKKTKAYNEKVLAGLRN